MHVEGSASILALIELNHLTKTFKGKTQTVDALKDINLHIEQGDIFGIIGMSGAGKSSSTARISPRSARRRSASSASRSR